MFDLCSTNGPDYGITPYFERLVFLYYCMKQSEINGKLNRILNINFSGEMLKMLETILIIFLTIPLYAVLIWSYFYPQESLLWGKTVDVQRRT